MEEINKPEVAKDDSQRRRVPFGIAESVHEVIGEDGKPQQLVKVRLFGSSLSGIARPRSSQP